MTCSLDLNLFNGPGERLAIFGQTLLLQPMLVVGSWRKLVQCRVQPHCIIILSPGFGKGAWVNSPENRSTGKSNFSYNHRQRGDPDSTICIACILNGHFNTPSLIHTYTAFDVNASLPQNRATW